MEGQDFESGFPGLHRARWAERHPATAHYADLFDYEHLRAGRLRDTSRMCSSIAELVVGTLYDGPELSAGLRKLLEAKDCFVRQALKDERQDGDD